MLDGCLLLFCQLRGCRIICKFLPLSGMSLGAITLFIQIIALIPVVHHN